MAEDSFKIDWDKIDRMVGPDGTVATGQDTELSAEFYMGKMPNADLTDYTEVPHIRLQAPGSKTVYDQPARLESHPNLPSDPERFPLAWQAFRAGCNYDGNGTPLTELEGISENDIRRLELNGIRTVQQLAKVADNHLDGLGFGGRILRDRARSYAAGKTVADPEKAEMRDQIGKLTDILGALMDKTGISMEDLIPADGAGDGQPARARRRQAAEV